MDQTRQNPLEGKTVEFYNSDGDLLGDSTTDDNGYFHYYYKHKGKRADFTLKLVEPEMTYTEMMNFS